MRRTLMWSWRGLAVPAVLALLLVAVGCARARTERVAGADDALPLTEPVTLRVGHLPAITNAALYVARDRGYFAAERLEIELVQAIGTDAQLLASTGELDAYLGGLSATFFNGIANGLDVSVVGQNGQASADGRSQSEYVVRPDSGVTTVADLRGEDDRGTGWGRVAGWQLHSLLTGAGMTLRDVRIVNLAAADGPVAVENGQADASVAHYPPLAADLASGRVVMVGDVGAATRPGSGNALVLGASLTADNRRAGTAFLRALYRAVDTDLQGDWMQDPQLVDIVAQATGLPADVIRACPTPAFTPGLEISPELIGALQTLFGEQGLLGYKPLPLDRMMDVPLVEAARGGAQGS